MTSVIFSALSYWSAISSRKWAQSRFVLLSVILTMRFPAKGSLARNTVHTPQRLYS